MSLPILQKLTVFDSNLGKASRVMWPWSLVVLGAIAVIVTILDQHSTYVALSFNPFTKETGSIPRWFIENIGTRGLALWGVFKIIVYVGVYGGVAAKLAQWGLPGVGRAGFVLVTYAYLYLAVPTVVDNYRLAFG